MTPNLRLLRSVLKKINTHGHIKKKAQTKLNSGESTDYKVLTKPSDIQQNKWGDEERMSIREGRQGADWSREERSSAGLQGNRETRGNRKQKEAE